MKNQYVWMIEYKANNEYLPLQSATSRDGARALQRKLKASGTLTIESRIRKYTADNNTRG